MRVVMTRCTTGDQLGWVERRLLDAYGREWLFEDKVPIFADWDIGFGTVFPKDGLIGCTVVDRQRDAGGREIIIVDTELPDHVEATNGETRFKVRPDQIVLLDRY